MAAYFRIGGMVILAVGAVYKLISTMCGSEDDPGHGFGLQEDDSGEVQDYFGGGTVLQDDPGDGQSLHVQDEYEYYNDEGFISQDENEDDGLSLQDEFSNLPEEFVPEVGSSDENFRNDRRSTTAEDQCFGTDACSTKIVKEAEEAETRSVVKCIKHYCSTQKILLVGEGNFSFSACLAKSFGSATNMVATSLDSYGFILSNYGLVGLLNLMTLQRMGCRVIHEVDATTMASHIKVGSMVFDRIVYNFPHAGFNKSESRESQLKRHKSLVRGFFKNARTMLSSGGEIHVAHKTNSFFNEWKIEELAAECGLRIIEKTTFNLSDYLGYETKYGFGGNENFNCYPSMTFKFGISSLQMPNRLGKARSTRTQSRQRWKSKPVDIG